jgi:DNA-binding MarR family transcriptional regulator
MISDLVRTIQRDFPKIYLACHVEHVRRDTTAHGISSRESAILSHLDPVRPMGAGDLASHLGVAASTLSGALRRLEGLGLVQRQAFAVDRRRVGLTLTEAGERALSEASVLNPERLAVLLAAMPSDTRQWAVEGLSLLAQAATALMNERHP